MTRHADAIILGAGNAGLGAAGVLREAGKSVTVVESRDVGGTCPIRGCVPKKVLVAAAQTLDVIARAPAHHIAVATPVVDWEKLIARTQGITDGVSSSFEDSLARRGIELVKGQARFAGPDRVVIGGETVTADHIVIATGSTPRPLDVPGAELLRISDDVLANPERPDSIVFIGGGVIALEFAHVYARVGVRATVLELAPRILPRLDEDLTAKLTDASRALGITIETGVSLAAVEPEGAGIRVRYRAAGEDRSVTADRGVNGAGRVPNLDGLDLAAGEVALDRGRLALDETLRSASNPRVYAAGDVLATPQLSPVATYEGRMAARNILGGREVPDYGHMPACVYTIPSLATVGLTEAEAKAAGLDVDVKTNDMISWRSARTYAETAAFAKVLVERGSGRIVGAHFLGHGGEEIINLIGYAMKHGMPAKSLTDFVYAYPTLSNDLKFLL